MMERLHKRFDSARCPGASLARLIRSQPCLVGMGTSMLMLVLPGCRDAPRATYPVTGRVEIQGQAAAYADLVFYDVRGRVPGGVRPYATTDQSGSFTVSTYGMNDGAPAGEYEVAISWKGPLRGIPPDQRDALPERLPERYLDPAASGVRVRVERGENSLETIQLVSP